MGLRGAPGAALAALYRPGVAVARRAGRRPASRRWAARRAPSLGPARRARAAGARRAGAAGLAGGRRRDAAPARIHCVNCGECNSVCPVYDAAVIRLPQTLTHRARGAARRRDAGGQHGAPARALHALRQLRGGLPGRHPAPRRSTSVSDEAGGAAPFDYARQARSLATIRASERYRDDFLAVRPGSTCAGPRRRCPAPSRFLVAARRERRRPGGDLPALRRLRARLPDERHPRVRRRRRAARRHRRPDAASAAAPASRSAPPTAFNGGQTLRVVEAPAPAWLEALEGFEGRRASPHRRAGRRPVTRLSNELAAVAPEARRRRRRRRRRAGARLDDWEQVLVAIVDPESPRLADPRPDARRCSSTCCGAPGIEPDEFWALDRARRGHALPAGLRASVARRPVARAHRLRHRQAAQGALPPRAAHRGRRLAPRLLALVLLARRDHAPGQRRPARGVLDRLGHRAQAAGGASSARATAGELLGARRRPPRHAARRRAAALRRRRRRRARLPRGDRGRRRGARHPHADAGRRRGRQGGASRRGAAAARRRPGRAARGAPRAGGSARLRSPSSCAPRASSSSTPATATSTELADGGRAQSTPGRLLSVYLRYDGDAFWPRLEAAARRDGVALVHFHSGAAQVVPPDAARRRLPQGPPAARPRAARLGRRRHRHARLGGDASTRRCCWAPTAAP